MTHFSYTARDPLGRIVSGQIEAASMQTARADIVQQGLTLEEIHEGTPEQNRFVSSEPAPAWESTDAPVAPVSFAMEGDTPSPAFAVADDKPQHVSQEALPDEDIENIYFPISRTLALYAGWLLAYYCLVYAIGWYQHTRSLPFRIPYVEALLLSPLVLGFSLAAFLYLILSTIHRVMDGGIVRGVFLFLTGVALLVLYQMNVI